MIYEKNRPILQALSAVVLSAVVLSAVVLSAVTLSGCGETAAQPLVITHERYQRHSHETIEVMRGDLTPELSLSLETDGRTVTTYDAPRSGMAVEAVKVSVGDRVEKGQELIVFDAGELSGRIEEYREEIETKRLLIEHYSRLAKISGSDSYSEDIAHLRRDIEIAQAYIEEEEKLMEEYRLTAERDGTITAVSRELALDTITDPNKLITEISGSGRFTAAAGDDYPFSVGERYTAKLGADDYGVRLIAIEEGRKDTRVLTFEPLAETDFIPDTQRLGLKLRKETLRNVVYVDARAVKSTDEMSYVYLLDEDGFREFRRVTPGERVGELMVITEGLSGGELVTVEE